MDNTICTYFTHAGNVSPFDRVMASPLPLARRAEAVARAGFAGMGFGLDDFNQQATELGVNEINRILRANGLQHTEVEVLLDWFVEGPRRAASDLRRAQLLQAAEQLGARHIKVAGDLSGVPQPMSRLVAEFQQLCSEAAAVGTSVTIELFPSSNLADLQTGFALVDQAGCRNGGLLLDIWHMVRGHIPIQAIASLPTGVINHIELDDGTLLPSSDYFTDTCCSRLPCGEGEFPLAEFMQAVKATGYDGLYGTEILSASFRSMDVEAAVMRAGESTRYALSLQD